VLPPPTLQAYWVRFAMTGDPNGPGLPRWPEFTRKHEYLEFTDGGPVAKRELRAAICDLLSRP
jgi:para-nitrobenzyl esterase